jgi:transposase-like protein
MSSKRYPEEFKIEAVKQVTENRIATSYRRKRHIKVKALLSCRFASQSQ